MHRPTLPTRIIPNFSDFGRLRVIIAQKQTLVPVPVWRNLMHASPKKTYSAGASLQCQAAYAHFRVKLTEKNLDCR
jgi:hypothetical protein